MLNQAIILMCYLSKVSFLFPRSSKSFLNFRLSSTGLLIKWFLITKTSISLPCRSVFEYCVHFHLHLFAFLCSHVRSDRRIVMINTCACILLGSVIFLGGAMLSSFKLIKGDISKVRTQSIKLEYDSCILWSHVFSTLLSVQQVYTNYRARAGP